MSTNHFSSKRLRNAPWNGFDVLGLFVFYLLLMQFCVGLSLSLSGVRNIPENRSQESIVEVQETAELKTGQKKKATKEHPLTQLLQKGEHAPLILFVAVLSALFSAPLAEEFLFRLVLQRWLEKKARQFRVLFRPIRFLFSTGIFSITVTSFLFGLAHAGGRLDQSPDYWFYALLGVAATNLILFCLGIVYLNIFRRATWADLGLRFDHIGTDLSSAIQILFLVVPAVFGIHFLTQWILPDCVTDPVPIFVLSLFLGILLHRSGRLLPSIFLHCFWNGINFLLVLLIVWISKSGL